MDKRSEVLMLAEYDQLYQQIRGYEQGLLTIFQVSSVAVTALLGAILALFTSVYAKPQGVATVVAVVPRSFCYLFLAPSILVLSSVLLISDYRVMIYRAGYYIQVFIEQRYGGAQWHVRLAAYRGLKQKPGFLHAAVRFFQPRVMILWGLLLISVALFATTLLLSQGIRKVTLWQAAVGLIPLVGMLLVHFQYDRAISEIKNQWDSLARLKPEPNVPIQTD